MIVRDQQAFIEQYPGLADVAAGEYTGGLGNGGDQLVLVDASDVVIHDFTYDDSWHPRTDGEGFSLEIVNAHGDLALWNEASGWQPNGRFGGTPGSFGGDFSGDEAIAVDDAELLHAAVVMQSENLSFDLSGDGTVNVLDLNIFVTDIAHSVVGDTDLDGVVDSQDFANLAARFGTAGGFTGDDTDADNIVSFRDFVRLINNCCENGQVPGRSQTELNAGVVEHLFSH